MNDADRDLVIIAPARAEIRDVETILTAPGDHFEVHFNRRRGNRRRALERASDSAERRQHVDRRRLDISKPLRAIGWVLVPADQRSHS